MIKSQVRCGELTLALDPAPRGAVALSGGWFSVNSKILQCRHTAPSGPPHRFNGHLVDLSTECRDFVTVLADLPESSKAMILPGNSWNSMREQGADRLPHNLRQLRCLGRYVDINADLVAVLRVACRPTCPSPRQVSSRAWPLVRDETRHAAGRTLLATLIMVMIARLTMPP